MVKKNNSTTVEMDNDGNVYVNGEKYIYNKSRYKKIHKMIHLDKHQFKVETPGEREGYEKVIIDKLKGKTSAEELLKETFRDIPTSQLKRAAKRIKAKKKIQKHKGCLGFKLGDTYLELFD